jgi:single-strand DNA-binding protein
MASYNKTTIIGNMGGDPSVKEKSTYVSVATNESWKDKQTDEWQEKTSWHKVMAYGYVAEKLNSLTKGTTILVEGTLDYFTPKEEGETPAAFIKAQKIVNLSSKPKDSKDDIPY